MAQEIQHSGRVVRVEPGMVEVAIISRSACGSCAAKSACGLAEATEKRVQIYTAAAADYAVDQEVLVGVKQRVGARAVLLAYVGALVVLLATLIGATTCGVNEGIAVAVTLAAVVVYYGVLRLMRKKIDNTIQFTITQI